MGIGFHNSGPMVRRDEELCSCLQDPGDCLRGTRNFSPLRLSLHELEESNGGRLLGDLQHHVLDSDADWSRQVWLHSPQCRRSRGR